MTARIFRSSALVLSLGLGAGHAQPVPQVTRVAESPLRLVPDPATGRFARLTNASARPLGMAATTPNGTVEIRDRNCSQRVETTRNANGDPQTSLAPGKTVCLYPFPLGSPETAVTVWAYTAGQGGWSSSVRLNGAPGPTPITLPLEFTVQTGDLARACPNGLRSVDLFSSTGGRLVACLASTAVTGSAPAEHRLGLVTERPAPGTYVGTTSAFSVDDQPARVTVNVRRPWWWALGLIAAGLLLPAALKFLADRHREKKALELAMLEEGLSPRQPPALSVPAGGPAVLRLDVAPATLVGGLHLAPTQPFSDLRDTWQALGVWRDLLPPQDVYGKLAGAVTALDAQIGPLSGYVPSPPVQAPARLLPFLQGIVAGQHLGRPLQVPVSRAAEVVADLRAALRLARTAERLNLPRLQWAVAQPAASTQAPGALALLERLVFEVTPSGRSAAEMGTYTDRLVELGDVVLTSAVGGAATLAPGKAPAGADPLSVIGPPLGTALNSAGRRANLGVRFYTLPLLTFSLAVACVLGLKTLYFDNPTWGQTALDYWWALAGGAGGFAAATAIEGILKSQLSGSAFVPGLLRRLLPGVKA